MSSDMQTQADEAKKKREMDDLLLTACSLGLMGDLQALVEDRSADVNSVDKNGIPAIYFAATRGNVDCVRYLIQHGADVEAETKEGRSPMHAAAIWGHLEVIDLLASRNAYLEGVDSNDDTPLLLAVRHSSAETVERLLKFGASMSARPRTGVTALGEALVRDKLDIAEVLVARGASVDDRPRGYSLLHLTLGLGLPEAARFVLRRAKLDAKNGARNPEGLTALHAAVLSRSLPAVQLLLSHLQTLKDKDQLLDVNAISEDGKTALDLVREEDAAVRTALVKAKCRAAAEVAARPQARGGGAFGLLSRPSSTPPPAPSKKLTPAEAFPEMAVSEQDKHIKEWFVLDEAGARAAGLGEEARARLGKVRAVEQEAAVHGAFAAVREDRHFQDLMQDPGVRQAFDEVKADCNNILKWNGNERVMYVMQRFRKFQNVLRPYGEKAGLGDLMVSRAERARVEAEDKRTQSKLRMVRAAEWAAARAAISAGPDEHRARASAAAAAKEAIKAAIKEEEGRATRRLAAPSRPSEAANVTAAAAAAAPRPPGDEEEDPAPSELEKELVEVTSVGATSDLPVKEKKWSEMSKEERRASRQQKREERKKAEEEYMKELEKNLPEPRKFETWREFWVYTGKELAKNMAIIGFVVGVMLAGKKYGFGPLAQMEQFEEAKRAASMEYAANMDANRYHPSENEFEDDEL